jgi:ribosomal-protein-serine acetyltransferase
MLRTDLGDGAALRPFRVDDADELHAVIAANRDRLRPWMPWADQDTEGTRQYLRDATMATRDVQSAITLDGRMVGTIGLVHPAGHPMLGYWLSEEAQGRGIMTRAVLAYVEHAFADLGYERVELRAAVDNVRSRAVAERTGFELVRIVPDAAVIDGRSVDHVVYERRRQAQGRA